MRDGSGKWLPSQWQYLLKRTLEAMESLPEGIDDSWTFGGGTALAIDLGHRISYDVDAFLDSAKAMQALVPMANAVTRKICWNPITGRPDFQWPGKYLKLIINGVGEIDFLNSSPLLADGTVLFEFEGRTIRRERPAEIITKKIVYRGSEYKSRDVFDLAGVFLSMPDELDLAADSMLLTDDALKRTQARISLMKPLLAKEILEEVNPTDFGASYADKACDLALEALVRMRQRKAELGISASPGFKD